MTANRAAPAVISDPRDLPRPASTPGPRPQIAPEIWAVVEQHETTSRWALDPYGLWAIALADWISETRAEGRHVRAVLDMFEREATELHRAGLLVKAQNEGTFPRAQNLWFRYGKHASASAWVAKAFERAMTPVVVDSTPTTNARHLRLRGDG